MPFANMTSISSRNIDFHQLKQLMDEKMLYLIDVREKSELLETGTLPDSVNIPCTNSFFVCLCKIIVFFCFF